MIIVCSLRSAHKRDSSPASVFRLLTRVFWNKYCLQWDTDLVNFMLVSVDPLNFILVSVNRVNFMLVSMDLMNFMLIYVDFVNFICLRESCEFYINLRGF